MVDVRHPRNVLPMGERKPVDCTTTLRVELAGLVITVVVTERPTDPKKLAEQERRAQAGPLPHTTRWLGPAERAYSVTIQKTLADGNAQLEDGAPARTHFLLSEDEYVTLVRQLGLVLSSFLPGAY